VVTISMLGTYARILWFLEDLLGKGRLMALSGMALATASRCFGSSGSIFSGTPE